MFQAADSGGESVVQGQYLEILILELIYQIILQVPGNFLGGGVQVSVADEGISCKGMVF